MQDQIEQWIADHWWCIVHEDDECDCSNGFVSVNDLRALLAGRVLCNAEPVAWMWRCPAYCADRGWHPSKGRPADHKKPTESYEDYPLYAAADIGKEGGG
jgi:hypothetical protein